MNVNKARHQLVLEYYPVIEKYDTPEAKEYMNKMKSWRVFTLCNYCSFEEGDNYFYGPSANDKKEYIENYLIYLDELLQVKPDYMSDENHSYPDPYDKPRNSEEYERRKKELPQYWEKQQSMLAAKKAELAQNKRNKEYWRVHQSEKNQLEVQLKEIAKEKTEIQKNVSSYNLQLKMVEDERECLMRAADQELVEFKSRISDLENQKSKLGIFASKKKKELQAQIELLNTVIPDIEDRIQRHKLAIQTEANAKLEVIRSEQKPYTDRFMILQNKENAIRNELDKNR